MRKISKVLQAQLIQSIDDSNLAYDQPDFIDEGTHSAVRFIQDPAVPNVLRISFRGTIPTDKKNLWDDLDFDQVSWKGLKAHHGFSRCVDALLPIVQKRIQEFMLTSPIGPQIILEGHSLGAALAILTLWVIKFSAPLVDLRVFAVEPPRSMGRASSHLYNSMLKDKVTWTRNEQDVITHAPLSDWGYRHVGHKIQLGSRWNWWTAFFGKKWAHLLPQVKVNLLKLQAI